MTKLLTEDQLQTLADVEASKDKTLHAGKLEAFLRQPELYGEELDRVRRAQQAARAAITSTWPQPPTAPPVDEVTKQLARIGIERQGPARLPEDQLSQLADLVADRLRPQT